MRLNLLPQHVLPTVLLISLHAVGQQLLAPAWPLAVKNPYLNTWYQAGTRPGPLNFVWPNFWDISITGWYCHVQVDGVPYRLMGDSIISISNTSRQSPVQITPTQTIIEVEAGPVNVTMTFLSPIAVRPFYYLRRAPTAHNNPIMRRLQI